MRIPLITFVIAFICACVLTPVARKIAIRFGVIDHPDARRVHVEPTPRWGGLAIYASFVIAMLVAVAFEPRLQLNDGVAGILVGGTLVAIIGMLDDKYDLSPLLQFGAILVGAGILIAFGNKIDYINPFGTGHSLGHLTIPITLLWIFGVTKTVDLMDGLDGLAAGICAIASTTLLVMSLRPVIDPVWGTHHPIPAHAFTVVRLASAALLGTSLGFLRFNYPPAKIFMGTIGAQFMGFVIASSSVVGAFKVATILAIAVPLMVLALPILDTAFVILRRAIRGTRVYEADKSHVHHRLLERGLTQTQTIWVIYGLTSVLSAAGLVLFWSAR